MIRSRRKDFLGMDSDGQAKVFGSYLVDEPVHCLMKSLLTVVLAIGLQIENAVSPIAEAFEFLCEVTGAEIGASFNRFMDLRHANIIGECHLFVSQSFAWSKGGVVAGIRLRLDIGLQRASGG